MTAFGDVNCPHEMSLNWMRWLTSRWTDFGKI